MRVVDTSIWIEIALGSDCGRRALALFPASESCIVPTIVQYELSRWFSRSVGGDAADGMIARTAQCVVVPLDTPLAICASSVAREYGLAMADAIVYATAEAHDAELLTCDKHFEGLPNVLYMAKTEP